MRATNDKTRKVAKADLVELSDAELSDEDAAVFEGKIQQADREIDEARVNFRWGTEQVDVVKKAAALAGVPYQTWMKTVLFERAIANINQAKAAGIQ